MSLICRNLASLQNTRTTMNAQSRVAFRASSMNSLERTPESDNYKKVKQNNTGKIVIGSLCALGLVALGALAFKGKLNTGHKNLKDVFNVKEVEVLGYDDILKAAKEKSGTVKFDEIMIVKGNALKGALDAVKVKATENENAIMMLLNKQGSPEYQEVFLPKKLTQGIIDVFNDKDVFVQPVR